MSPVLDKAMRQAATPVTERGRDLSEQSIQNVATYQQPIRALYRGRPVTIIATGDLPGHSQLNQFVDEDGRLNWANEEDFQVIDPNLVPLTYETMQRIVRSLERER